MSSRKYRKRKKSSSDDDSEGETDRSIKLSDVKDAQQMRCKRGGINALSLAAGRIVTAEEEVSGKVFTKATSAPKEKEKYGLQVGNAFFAESNQKEDEQLMNVYIQEELAKRRGQYSIILIYFNQHF